MITPIQIAFVVLVSAIAAFCTKSLTKKMTRKKEAIYDKLLVDVFTPLLPNFVGVKLTIVMGIVEGLLRRHQEIINARVYVYSGYGMVVYALKPKHDKKKRRSAKICILYNHVEGEDRRVVGSITLVHIPKDRADASVEEAYRKILKDGDYDNVSEIVEGSHGKGFVVIKDLVRTAIGVIKKEDACGRINMSILKELDLNEEATKFVFTGHILDL